MRSMDDSSPLNQPLTREDIIGIVGFIVTTIGLGVGAGMLEFRFHIRNGAFFFLLGGGALVIAALWKPWPFWWHAKAMFLRSLIGDRATTFAYLLLGLAGIGWGSWRIHTWTETASRCRVAYTGASTIQERMGVLRKRLGPEDRSCDELREFGAF